MSIRREDKEFIQSMAVLGALLGVCIGAFLIMHLSDRAHKLYAQEREYLQTHAALVKLSTTTVTPNNPIASKEVLDQVQQQFEQAPAVEETDIAKSFWVTIPRWKLWGFCAVGGAAGALIGYVSIWITGWMGSAMLYHFLRMLYAGIRKAAPHCAAAEQSAISEQAGAIQYERNDKRILPTVIKLLFFLILILALLTAVVWRLTNL